MCSYNKTQVSHFDPTKIALLSTLRQEDDLISKCGQNFKNTVSFDDIAHFIDDGNIVTNLGFDCGNYPETPTKLRQINREQNYLSRSCEKLNCIPSNHQQNCFIDEQYNYIIFLNPCNFWDMVAAALVTQPHY